MCAVHLIVDREKYCSFVLYLYEQRERERERSNGKMMGYGIHEHCSLLRRGRKLSVLYQVQASLGPTQLSLKGIENPYLRTSLYPNTDLCRPIERALINVHILYN
jgi:hypothetical protein